MRLVEANGDYCLEKLFTLLLRSHWITYTSLSSRRVAIEARWRASSSTTNATRLNDCACSMGKLHRLGLSWDLRLCVLRIYLKLQKRERLQSPDISFSLTRASQNAFAMAVTCAERTGCGSFATALSSAISIVESRSG
jgi:hypothetical protein